MEIEEMQEAYETMVSDLLSWINTNIMDMAKPFHKSLSAVKKEMTAFKHFRTIEKPPK
jgi:spectrin beta